MAGRRTSDVSGRSAGPRSAGCSWFLHQHSALSSRVDLDGEGRGWGFGLVFFLVFLCLFWVWGADQAGYCLFIFFVLLFVFSPKL